MKQAPGRIRWKKLSKGPLAKQDVSHTRLLTALLREKLVLLNLNNGKEITALQ